MALVPKKKTAVRDLEQDTQFVSTMQRQGLFKAVPGITKEDTRVDRAGNGHIGDTIPVLCPLTFDSVSDKWIVWADGQEIDGFAMGPEGLSLPYEGIKLSKTGEVLGLICMGGIIPADQVPLPQDQTLSDLQAQLRTGMRAKNFDIVNLDGVS